MQKNALKAFLVDESFRKRLKEKHDMADQQIDNVTMSSKEEIVELNVLKALIRKQHEERATIKIIAGQITNLVEAKIK